MTHTIAEKLSQFLRKRRASPAIEWGAKSDADRLGVGHRTRYWAHAWVRERMSRLPLHQMSVVDVGSGTSNPLLDWYRPKVKHAYLLDLSPPSRGDNWELINCDLERPLPFRDEFVDLITTVSSIEHLSAAGQLLFMSEAERILKPNGRLIMTLSYICSLTPDTLAPYRQRPSIRGHRLLTQG